MVTRGGPRPRRSRWWWLLTIPALLTVLLVVLVGVGISWFVGRARSFSTVSAMLPAELAAARKEGLPLEPAVLREHPPVPESRNAAPLYRQLDALYRATPKAQQEADGEACSAVIGRGRTEAQRAAARDVLARRAAWVRLAERATDRPRCDFQRAYEQGPDLLLPEYATGRSAARLLAARAVLEGDAGRVAEAFRDIERCRRLARHMAEDRCLIASLVGIAIDAIADRAFQEVVLAHADNPEVLRLARASEQAWRQPANLRRAMGSEVVMGRVVVDMVRQQRGTLEGLSLPADWSRSSRRTRLMMADAWEARLLQYWRQVYAEMRAHPGDDIAMARAADRLGQQQVDSKSDPTYLLNGILMPVFSQAWLKEAGGTELHRLRSTLLDVVVYRQKHGTWPASLAESGGRVEPDIFSGKPPIYRRTPNGFVLYSVGENMRDDGGKRHGPPPDKKLLDIVISWPDQEP